MRISVVFACFLVTAASAACKTTAPKERSSLVSDRETGHQALTIQNFDLPALKKHLANSVELIPAGGRSLWAVFLVEGTPGSPCPGVLGERYFFYSTGRGDEVTGYHLADGKAMPMNGPCGLAWEVSEKTFKDVSGALIDSAPLRDIDTLDRLRISPAEAVKMAESKHPTFKYRDGVKLFHHPYPELSRDPLYMIFGTSCGRDSSVMVNGASGAFVDTIDSPTNPCEN